MEVPKKILKQWDKDAEQLGVMDICREAGINHRTFMNARNNGKCKIYIYDLINDAIIRMRKKREKKEAKFLEQDAD